MGTEIHVAVNLLRIPNPKGLIIITTINSVKKKVKRGMDQDSRSHQEQQDIEGSIKTTMLIQEDTFKQQVRELHRLYAVQKILMTELRSRYEQHPSFRSLGEGEASTSASVQSGPSSRGFSRLELSSQGIAECNEEVEVELTLSLGGRTSRTAPHPEENEQMGRGVEPHWIFRGIGSPRPSR